MPGIFISYRREDSEMAAGRLADGLRPHFGKDQVFIDVVTLQGGENWAEKIRQAVDFAQVVLVLIGNSWLTAQDAHGRRRLTDPTDSVRIEVEQALAQDHVRVIPVLLEGAPLPRPQDLPETIVSLSSLQTFTLAHASWERDFKRLKETLEEVVWATPPTRRWATRQFEESKKLAHKTSAQAQKVGQSGRVFHAPDVDLSEVARVLVSFYEQQKMETQALPVPEGYLVEARHRGALRAVAGLQSSMKVLLSREGDKLQVQIGSGKWLDKGLATAISPWFPPTLFTAGYGLWRQSRLPERTYERVQYFLEGRVQGKS